MDVRFDDCPSCGEPVELTHYPGGFVVAACPVCHGGWESHGDIVRRMGDGELEDPTSGYTPDDSVPMDLTEGSSSKGAHSEHGCR
jgi:hypothetical protein